jgi:hypothetical protein
MNGAKESGEKAAEEAFKEGLEQIAEEAFLPHILKMCEEEGQKKGEEVFGDFGGQVSIHDLSRFSKYFREKLGVIFFSLSVKLMT